MNNNNLKKYKNIHKGKRVFLIGNGPSLAQTDLDLIKDEYSIAMCRISLIYDNLSEKYQNMKDDNSIPLS